MIPLKEELTSPRSINYGGIYKQYPISNESPHRIIFPRMAMITHELHDGLKDG